MINLQSSLQKLRHHIESEAFRGYDPYDALQSPLFHLPFLRSNKLVRFSAQQFVKRSPINLRPFLFVPKGYNPVTLGLCIQAYAYLIKSARDEKKAKEYSDRIDFLIDELIGLRAKGYSGTCWGYDFDWEARYSRIPSYQPTVVATGIITNGLFECFRFTNKARAIELCSDAVEFVLKDLHRTYEGSRFCFSYSPFDKQVVFNASMKGARCLAQVYSVTRDERLQEEAARAVEFVANHQREDGSWYYSASKTGRWIDNYHTGYVLECLSEYIRCTGDKRLSASLEKGSDFYKENFFESNRIPKFYHNQIYPIDCTSAAQSILTLIKLAETGLATRVGLWMIEHMQCKDGYFYFRKYKNHLIKTPFMRWSQAWMMLALANLERSIKEKS